jgi:hypothetical protein
MAARNEARFLPRTASRSYTPAEPVALIFGVSSFCRNDSGDGMDSFNLIPLAYVSKCILIPLLSRRWASTVSIVKASNLTAQCLRADTVHQLLLSLHNVRRVTFHYVYTRHDFDRSGKGLAY